MLGFNSFFFNHFSVHCNDLEYSESKNLWAVPILEIRLLYCAEDPDLCVKISGMWPKKRILDISMFKKTLYETFDFYIHYKFGSNQRFQTLGLIWFLQNLNIFVQHTTPMPKLKTLSGSQSWSWWSLLSCDINLVCLYTGQVRQVIWDKGDRICKMRQVSQDLHHETNGTGS